MESSSDYDYLRDDSVEYLGKHEDILKKYKYKQLLSNSTLTDPGDFRAIIKPSTFIPSIQEAIALLDSERIPQIPGPLEHIPENPPPYNAAPLEFPLESSKKREEKKEKKSEKSPPKVADSFKFVTLPGHVPRVPEKSRTDKFSELQSHLSQGLYSETAKSLYGNSGMHPFLLSEVLFPEKAPPHISNLIDSVFALQSRGNFVSAVETLETAKEQWASENRVPLTHQIEIFFEFTKGSIFLTAGKTEVALGVFMNMRDMSNKLIYTHPDKALMFCGMGTALSHLKCHSGALRCFLEAKKIREMVVGGDTADTATTYNNVGVEMYHVGRFQESIAYLQLAVSILGSLHGTNNQRTLVAKRNIQRVQRTACMTDPEFPIMWKKQFPDPYAPAKKKKKGKKKKS